jgi:hypothetical protein
MNFSNLDHIQTIDNEAQELAGGSYYYGDNYHLSSYVNISGNRAVASASANAYGNNTFTRASSGTFTDGYSSSSSASSDSATDDYYYWY